MARKTYTIKMTFTNEKAPDWEGKSEQSVPKSRIQETVEYWRGWLAAHNHTETSLLITDSEGHTLYDSTPRQETDLERGLRNADSARRQLAAWDWPGLR
jgi:hypothetical protein